MLLTKDLQIYENISTLPKVLIIK